MDACDRLFSLQSFPTLLVGYFLWCPLVVFSKVFSFDSKFPSSLEAPYDIWTYTWTTFTCLRILSAI